MAGETIITVVGNLTADPEFRYTPSGAAVVNFTIASTPRTFDRQTNEWKDGEPLFLRASAWRDMAEHISESLRKGTQVIATGRLKSRSYQTKEGESRTSMELEIDEVGPSLRFATATVTRATGGSGGNNRNFGGNAPAAQSQSFNAPQASYGQAPATGTFGAPAAPQANSSAPADAANPWNAPAPGDSPNGWGSVPADGAATQDSEEPPF